MSDLELWTDVLWGFDGGLPEVMHPRTHDEMCWFVLGRRREDLYLAETDHYEALGRSLVAHLHASRGGPLVVEAYASPELEFIDWEEATDTHTPNPSLEGDLSVIPGEEAP